jgi:hypothetical protein
MAWQVFKITDQSRKLEDHQWADLSQAFREKQLIRNDYRSVPSGYALPPLKSLG